MKKASVFLCGLVLAASASTCALADTINFTFAPNSNPINSSEISGSLVLTVTEQSTGKYLVTGITGTVDEGSKVGSGQSGVAVDTTPLAVGTLAKNGYTNDNLILDPKGSYYFDKQGLAFTLSDGVKVLLYQNDAYFTFPGQSSRSEEISKVTESGVTSAPSVPTAAAPEPNSLMLVGTGILGLAGLVRRKLRS